MPKEEVAELSNILLLARIFFVVAVLFLSTSEHRKRTSNAEHKAGFLIRVSPVRALLVRAQPSAGRKQLAVSDSPLGARTLASRILFLCARQLPADWERLYGYRPLHLETLMMEHL